MQVQLRVKGMPSAVSVTESFRKRWAYVNVKDSPFPSNVVPAVTSYMKIKRAILRAFSLFFEFILVGLHFFFFDKFFQLPVQH